MTAALSTRLHFNAQHTTLATDSTSKIVLAVGAQGIADSFFRHDPPLALEIEQAIDAVEDALMSSRLQHAERGGLVTDEPLLQAWVSGSHPQSTDTRLTRDEVEAIFERLATASLGRPGALVDLPTERTAAAALLILRESMHHLGFDSVRIVSRA